MSLLLLLLGCPAEETPPSAPAPGGDAAAPGGAPGSPGVPPGGGTDPNAATGSGPVPTGGGQLPTLQVEAGSGVKLSGSLAYSGTATGSVRLDVMSKAGGNPQVVHAVKLEQLGAFEIELPKGYGAVTLSAFIDQQGDGPSPGEPVGSVEVEVKDVPIGGLAIQLADTPASADGAATPPGGAAPGGAAPAGR